MTQRITRGVAGEPDGTTLVVYCTPLPLAERARYYRDGIDVRTSTIRRTPPWAQSPQAKTLSLLNLRLAELEVGSADADAWPVLCDEQGNLAEGLGSNIFAVREGRVLTPQARYVLPGVARATVLDLAGNLGFETSECDIDLFEATTADELFLTSTSLCVCPVASLNGVRPRCPEVPGPVTQQLQDAFSELVRFDFVGQYLAVLEPARG